MLGKEDNNYLKINAIIFDWSGTTVDYGCMAPAITFKNIFSQNGIEVDMSLIRSFMGLPKKEHIRKLLENELISNQWLEKYGKKPDSILLDKLYNDFTPQLFKILGNYSKPINGVTETVKELKHNGLKIGSTTGYTKEMMQIVLAESRKYSYEPDCIVTPEEAGAGRPMPFMCYLNLIKLKVYPAITAVKVGDTISDIKEGLNAGMWSIGVIKGSNELGLSQDEIDSYDKKELSKMIKKVRDKFYSNGAHFVLDKITDIFDIIKIINKKLYKMRRL